MEGAEQRVEQVEGLGWQGRGGGDFLLDPAALAFLPGIGLVGLVGWVGHAGRRLVSLRGGRGHGAGGESGRGGLRHHAAR